MKFSGSYIATLLTIIVFYSCSKKTIPTTTSITNNDILVANMDTSIKPQDDYFAYANGGWIKKNPIPDEYNSNGIARLVQDDLLARLRTINEEAAHNAQTPIAQKIGAFWNSGMDSAAINKNGLQPILPLLQQIDTISNLNSYLQTTAALNKKGVSSLFNFSIYQDEKNSNQMAVHIGQGGLGLPDRDYYFNTDSQTTKVRNAYAPHIQKMLSLAGITTVQNTAAAQQIMQFETALAAASRKLEDLRDPYKNYNKTAVTTIQPQYTPIINWNNWLQQVGVTKVDSVIIGQPEFLQTLDSLLQKTPLTTLKAYLKWQTLRAFAPYLGDDFDQAQFNFYGKTMTGSKKQQPRWKRVLNTEEGVMGEALGQLFVTKYFDSTAKKRYENMVYEIKTAMKNRIQQLDWMSPATKEKALLKLATMKQKVGYPDRWKNFSAMQITNQPYVLNIIAANEWWHQYYLQKLNKPVDRDEWEMTPQTYNAYYNPSNNEIVLPAGIFTVPGKQDAELDDALVYGYAAASTIGHEITHAFDDQGRQFDEVGNLNNWWTKDDEEKFNANAAKMVQQFNAYEPLKGMHINGEASLGENIADLGGVLLGWDAFTQTQQYKENKKINGLSPAERYFLGYSLGWLYNIRDEALAQRLLTDVHSPAKYRVNGSFVNVDAFYKTYNIKPTDSMYTKPENRVRIW